ncbi:B-cell receptor CD22-like [Pygocentrus nattereri]|uniref:B-cell receptor CD22-like n=1 Tax=Pygocentrus nattereri TaxID=42514 RepID=UPI0018919E3B|nr:B-cell receptor CD22-like [Pygocentrus nattereri]
MRSLRTAPPLPLVFLLMTAGAFGTEWSVKYNQLEICALNGSTVFMNATFTHPEGLTVKETFWGKHTGVELSDLSKDPDYSGRVEFFIDDQKHFSLKLSDVVKKDEHRFRFRIITNVEKERWWGKPGVQLRVTELHVEAPEEVTEGQTADLTCKTTCSLTDPKFIWYKNGRPLTTKTIKNNQLHLQKVSSEDAGSYSCAIGGSQDLRSTAHSLRVRHPPKNISVSISPSGEIMEGTSLNLTCSSDGNPPVKNYTWFKGSASVGEGKTYSIPNIRSEDSGEYACQSRNDHGEGNSTAVKINVKYPPKNVSVSISPSAEIVEGTSVNLTCSSDGNPPVKNYTWFKGSASVGEGKTYSIPKIRSEDSGEYTCQIGNDHGEGNSTAVQINVKYPPKNVSMSISPSGEIMEGTSLNLTCSSDGNPPVKNYTWFKGSASVGEGKTYSIPNIRSEDSGEYACQSRNDHGEGNSTAVKINVKYPPKNVSVSISPSAEIVEGTSVNLTCSSDGNPPVKNYTWFKGSASVGEGKTYSIPKIRSEDSGEYTCQIGNDHGEGNSTAVQINVKYPPKNVSMSMSPSGEIVEGTSVNLTCSSDGNPPVKNYTWFKGSASVGEGKTYSIPNIRSEDSGEYACQSRNDHGEGNSTAVKINVKLEGTSVNLTCSSDGNPPVKNYTWFKGSASVGEGKTYSIPKIRSEDSGEYTCQIGNDHGEGNSTAVQINVKYPPKNVSMSMSPSGEIVEGTSVNLTCSSDGNPPVKNYTWFKGSTPVGEGKTYSIPNIRSVDSGEYTCESQNDHGEGNSTAVQINVKYPPKNVSVSSSPSGEIVEISSMTLTCSSDGNPPVKNYTWFKGSASVGEGKTYSIPNIRSEDSGEYTCQSRNDLGERNSTAVQINVLYPPKSISVSICSSGEIVEGSSVTLTCSSDGNPPVKIYTWFKEGGTSPLGSGQNYNILSITADHTGLYYCEAQNDHGALNGTVMVTVKSRW